MLSGRAGNGDRWPHLPLLQAGGDGLHGADRAAGIHAAMHVQAVGPPSGRLQARVVDAVAAVRAGRITTSTPLISSVRAPLTAASNISCKLGDGV